VNELQQFAALRTWLISITGLATIIAREPQRAETGKTHTACST
jgi:hypothetical protein